MVPTTSAMLICGCMWSGIVSSVVPSMKKLFALYAFVLEKCDPCSTVKATWYPLFGCACTVPGENCKLPFPGLSELNARLRRIVAAFQKSHKKELLKQEQNEKVCFLEVYDLFIVVGCCCHTLLWASVEWPMSKATASSRHDHTGCHACLPLEMAHFHSLLHRHGTDCRIQLGYAFTVQLPIKAWHSCIDRALTITESN